MRPSLFLAALAFCAVAQAQLTDEELQVKVSHDCVAMPAGRVMADLSAKSGLKLDTTSATESEILIIRANDVPLAQLMDQIARVASGMWRKSREGWELIRPFSTASAEQNAEFQMKLGKIRKQIDDRYKTFEQRESSPQEGSTAAAEPAGGVGPFFGGASANKAIFRLLKVNDLGKIANLESGDRVVFATTPNRMQFPLQGNVAKIISDLVAEHNDSVKNSPNPSDELPAGMEEVREFLNMFGLDQKPEMIQGRVAKLVLSAGKQPMMGMIQLELKLYDANGKVVLQGQEMLQSADSNWDFSMAEELADALPEGAPGAQPKKAPVKQEGDKDIEFSAITKEMMGLFNVMGAFEGGQMAAEKISPELEARLIRPDLYDPLSYAVSESLIFSAKAKGINLVANIPDSYVSFFSGMLGEKTTVNAFLESIKKNKSLDYKESGGFVSIMASMPYTARKNRIDRPALARLLSAGKAKGIISLDDLAAYAQTNPELMETPLVMTQVALFAPGAFGRGMTGQNDWALIRFYGTLGQHQKKQMREGLHMSFTQLNPQQRPHVEKLLFGQATRIESGPDKSDESIPFLGAMEAFMPKRATSWKDEPTELMPTGIPNAGYLVISAKDDPVGMVEGDNKSPMTQMMGAVGPDELAFLKLLKEIPGMAEMTGQIPQIEKLRMGTRTTFKFGFQVGKEEAVRKQLIDDQVGKDGAVMSMSNVPAEFQARIDSAYEKIKKSPFFKMMQMASGMGGRPTEPPQI